MTSCFLRSFFFLSLISPLVALNSQAVEEERPLNSAHYHLTVKEDFPAEGISGASSPCLRPASLIGTLPVIEVGKSCQELLKEFEEGVALYKRLKGPTAPSIQELYDRFERLSSSPNEVAAQADFYRARLSFEGRNVPLTPQETIEIFDRLSEDQASEPNIRAVSKLHKVYMMLDGRFKGMTYEEAASLLRQVLQEEGVEKSTKNQAQFRLACLGFHGKLMQSHSKTYQLLQELAEQELVEEGEDPSLKKVSLLYMARMNLDGRSQVLSPQRIFQIFKEASIDPKFTENTQAMASYYMARTKAELEIEDLTDEEARSLLFEIIQRRQGTKALQAESCDLLKRFI